MDIPVAVAGWSNQAETFLTLIDAYKTKEMFCDCTLACKEKFFRAHKMILAMCSELFEKIFLTTQDKNPVIILHEIEAWQIECLLNYMYKGETQVSDSKFPSLCKVATYLQIKGFDKLKMYRQAVKAAKHKERLISSKLPSTDASWSTSYPSKYGPKNSPDFTKDARSESPTVHVHNFSHPSPQESLSRDGSYCSSQRSSVTDEGMQQKLETPQSLHRIDPGRYFKIKPEIEQYQTSQTLTSNLDMNHNSEFLSSPRLQLSSKHGRERNTPSSPEFKDAKLYWQSKYQSEMSIHRPAVEQMRNEEHIKKYDQCSKYRDYSCPQMSRKTLENHRLTEEDHRTATEEPWKMHKEQSISHKFHFNANVYRDQNRSASPSQTAVAKHVSSPNAKMHNQNQGIEGVYIKTEVEEPRLDEHSGMSEHLDSPLRTPEKVFHFSPSYLNNYAHSEGSPPNRRDDIEGHINLKHTLSNSESESNLSRDFSSNEATKTHKATGIFRALPPLLKIVSSPSSSNESFSLNHETANEAEEGKFRINDPLLEKIPTNKRKRVRGPKSWEFLLRLLRSPSGNPSLIKWEDEDEGIFRLIKPEVIAQRWGQRTGKHDHDVLSYESFSRGLRYHYATGALCAVSEKSFVYQFGPKAQKALKNPAHSPQNLLKQE